MSLAKVETEPRLFSSRLFTSSYFLLFAIILFCAVVIFAGGITASVSLGDEVHHYRFAKNSFVIKGRAIFDGLYDSSKPPGFPYETEVFWPLLLSLFWRVAGGISFPLAQIYHVGYFILLLLATFFVAKKYYGQKEALGSVLLLATAPIIVSFSILFYIDMPGTALFMLSLWALMERRYFVTGLLLGLQWLTRKSTVFFLPPIVIWLVVQNWENKKELIKSLVISLSPAFLLFLVDADWRSEHLYDRASLLIWAKERLSVALDRINKTFQKIMFSPDVIKPNAAFSNSSVWNGVDLIKYFGIPLLAGIMVYFICRRYGKKDWFLWFLTVTFVGNIIFWKILPDIRYLMPIVPLLAILASKAVDIFTRTLPRKIIFGVICLAQFLAAVGYTCSQRVIPPGIQEGFRFIKSELPQDALILYPEINLLEYAERRMVWTLLPSIHYLFWGDELEKVRQILPIGLSHIAIKKSRVYDDTRSKVLHTGQYPISFTKFLEKWPYVRKIFENQDLLLYEIDRESLTKLSVSP